MDSSGHMLRSQYLGVRCRKRTQQKEKQGMWSPRDQREHCSRGQVVVGAKMSVIMTMEKCP